MIVEKQSGKILAELGEADESARELSPKKTQQIEQKPAFFLNAVCSTEKGKVRSDARALSFTGL